MFCNSPRMGVPVHSPTSGYVGPTTYIVCRCYSGLVNKVPFLSSQERKIRLPKSYCEEYYPLTSFVQDVKGGISPRYQAERFSYGIVDSPGPLDYTPKIPGCSSSERKSGKGKLYVCKVPYSLKGSGPSVPTKSDENGYFLDEDNNIIKIPPNPHDTSLGPTFYKIKEPFVENRYRGCMWSKRTAKRSTGETNSNPGPGTYDVRMPKCNIDERIENFRQMAKLLSFAPRYLDAQEMLTLRENLPGPGQYDVRLPACNICGGVVPKPFISGSKRFKETISTNPSPADYEVGVNKSTSVLKKDIPFAVGAERFRQGNTNPFLGPASYTIKSPMDEKLDRKSNAFALTHAPFNTTTFRDTLHLKRDVCSTPSPANYLVEERSRCKIQSSSVFTSKVRRFPKINCLESYRSPASYNVIDANNFVRNHKSFNSSKVPFMAAAKMKGVMDYMNFSNPGPAKYSVIGGLSTRGYVIPASRRFPDPDDGIPGPGSYYIHPAQGDSIFKAYKTHNLVIKEGILRRRLRKHPRETWDKWASFVKKKKKLKCFYGISD